MYWITGSKVGITFRRVSGWWRLLSSLQHKGVIVTPRYYYWHSWPGRAPCRIDQTSPEPAGRSYQPASAETDKLWFYFSIRLKMSLNHHIFTSVSDLRKFKFPSLTFPLLAALAPMTPASRPEIPAPTVGLSGFWEAWNQKYFFINILGYKIIIVRVHGKPRPWRGPRMRDLPPARGRTSSWRSPWRRPPPPPRRTRSRGSQWSSWPLSLWKQKEDVSHFYHRLEENWGSGDGDIHLSDIFSSFL